MSARLAFVDTETTGLDPDRHWNAEMNLSEPSEYEWQLPVDLAKADPTGLRVGRFYERRRKLPTLGDPLDRVGLVHWPDSASWDRKPPDGIARDVAVLLDGAHMVGAVPSFDAAFLTRWLNAHGQASTWHYHLVDVEALAAGCLATQWRGYDDSTNEDARNSAALRRPPWNSNELSAGVGVDPGQFDRHTALGDARWAKAIYEKVMGA